MRSDAPELYGVYSARTLRDEYGFNSENRPHIRVSPNEVPEHLRPLIKDVEKWAIPCDVTRLDYISKQSDRDVVAFWRGVEPHVPAINAWLGSLGDDTEKWSLAALQFLDLLVAHDDAWRPTKEEKIESENHMLARSRAIELHRAIERASQAFSSKMFEEVVDLLGIYEGDLGEIESKKLEYSRKRAAGRGSDIVLKSKLS